MPGGEATSEGSVAGVVLAAGESSRFEGGLKQLAAVLGEPMVRSTCLTALEASLAPVVVVVGHRSEEVKRAIEDLPVRIVENRDWRLGQSGSVRCGVDALDSTGTILSGAIFLPCDQPGLDRATLERLVEAFRTTRSEASGIVVPIHRGRRGSPVLFGLGMFDQLRVLEGDEGGRQLLLSNVDRVILVELDDERPLLDIDTLEDLARFRCRSRR